MSIDYKVSQRSSTFKTRGKIVSRPERGIATVPAVGMGLPIDAAKIKSAATRKEGLGAILDLIQQSKENPWWNMDVVEQVRWTMAGPQTNASITENFGATIDLFASGKSPQDIDFVETTMAQPGQTQTYFVACYVGFHLEPDPMCFTLRGNAWTHPTVGQAQPPSPDVFTLNDVIHGALGTAFEGESTPVMLPAIMEHGWWLNRAFWELVRAYNFRWKIGQHINIMDEQLRHTAYMPPNAQDGSASSSETDPFNLINMMNQRYDSLGSALDFLPIDFLRIGSVGVTTVNNGRFVPTRDFDTVGTTYGGMDLRSMLRANSEFRQLCLPYIIEPGVPIGIFLQECDTVQGDIMRALLSISQIGGTFGGVIPPSVTPDANINAGMTATGATVMLERTLDAADVPQQVNAERVIFKSGFGKITLPIKGFEVTKDWYNQLSSDSDIRDIVLSDCGMKFAAYAA
jgi:hypothetical protein